MNQGSTGPPWNMRGFPVPARIVGSGSQTNARSSRAAN